MAPDPVTRGWGQAGPGVRVVGLGRWVGVRSPGQGHGRVLPVIGVVGLVMSGLGLGLRHTQQLGVTHPLCLLPVVSVARGEGHVTRAQPSRPGVQTILQRVTMAMGHGGQSGGSVSVSGGGELPPIPGGGERWLSHGSASFPGRWQGLITRWRHERPTGHGGDQPPVSGGAGPILQQLVSPGLGQRVESQESGTDSQEVVTPGDQSVHRVLQAQILLFQLMKGRQKRCNVKVTRLLHEKPTALLPVPLQELLQSLGLAGGVQHPGHGVRRAPPTVVSLASAGERDTDQLGGAINRVRRVRGNLVLKSLSVRRITRNNK